MYGFIPVLSQALLSRRALFAIHSLISNDFCYSFPCKKVQNGNSKGNTLEGGIQLSKSGPEQHPYFYILL